MGSNSVSYSESSGLKSRSRAQTVFFLSPVVIYSDITLNHTKNGYFHIPSNLPLADNPIIWCQT
jgi:hypothetical protein